MRKPIDPPPIVQLKVHSDKQQCVFLVSLAVCYADFGAHRNWLVNPFLFMNAVLVSHEDDRAKSQPKSLTGNQLLGQNVSSLHRLKDVNNRGKTLCTKTTVSARFWTKCLFRDVYPHLGTNVDDVPDGGFFVFGDISCRRTGTYRLQFNLFNYEKYASHNKDHAHRLTAAAEKRSTLSALPFQDLFGVGSRAVFDQCSN